MVSYGSVMLYFLGYGNVMLYFLGYGLFHYFLMYLELVKIVMYHFLLLVQPRCYLLWVNLSGCWALSVEKLAVGH